MKENKKHISKEDFQRYLENQMTDTERNTFERELQKHPFEAEALEGFQQISTTDLEKDLKHLSEKIKSGKKRNNTRYWAAAATLLLLVTTGVIWFQMNEKLPLREVAQTKSIQKEEIKTRQPEAKNPELSVAVEAKDSGTTFKISKKTSPEKVEKKKVAPLPVSVPLKKEEVELEKSVQLAAVNKPLQEVQFLNESKVATAARSEIRIRGMNSLSEKQKNGSGSSSSQLVVGNTKLIWGKVISLHDSLALPGVTITEKGTLNGTVSDADGNFSLKLANNKDSILTASFVGMTTKDFYPVRDSSLVVGLEAEKLALDEVVVVGYGTQKKVSLTGSVAAVKVAKNDSVATDSRPTDGMEHFRVYMDKHAVLPDNYPEKKVVVKVALQIDNRGKIKSVKNLNNAEAAIFEKARQFLLSGPAWNPKIINGNPVESEVTLRIVFRKEK